MQSLELYGEIGKDYEASLDFFTYRFNEIRREYPNEQILVKIHSEGGCLNEGLAIANTIELDGNTDTLNMGLAGSVAALILLKGRKRFSASSSFTMFHKAFFEGNDTTPEKQAILDKYNAEIIKLLVEKTKLGNSEVIDRLLNGMGLWLDSVEALKAGVIDQILYSEKALPDAKNRTDKLLMKCKSGVLNKLPSNKDKEMPITSDELKAIADSVKNGITEGNKPLLDEIGQLKNQLSDLVKNQANATPVDVAEVVKTAVESLVTPVLNDSKAMLEGLKTASESMSGVMDAIKNMPSPHNSGGASGAWGVKNNEGELR